MSGDRGLRVLFMCPNLDAGGAERQWSVLIPGLRDAGLPVSVLTLDGRGVFFDQLAQEGIPTAFADLRDSDAVGKAKDATRDVIRDLRDGDARNKAKDALRDLKDSDTVGKARDAAKDVFRDLKDSAGRRDKA